MKPTKLPTDINTGHVLCLNCQHVSPLNTSLCPVCDKTLHQRKLNSFNRTFYLTLAALILYIPSNYFTIMKTVSITTYENSTILGGIFYFFQHGEYFVGTVIFMASVFVPLAKLIILMFLLYSVKTGSYWRLVDKNRLHTVISLIGRWSMLDIFVMGMMISLVHFGDLATVTLGWASVSFATMVMITMFATESFDTRLLWDEKNEKI
jgi:paraquat-inducible protein A